MQRGTVILSAKTSPHAARKSEWLRSALAHHHCPDLGVENEIVVLATGIDQYIQEVFHHLAYPNRDDVVSAEDFEVLCSVLGLTGEKRKGSNTEGSDNEDEGLGVVSGLSCEIGFKDFHSRLCGFFRLNAARNGTTEKAERLPISKETELVEREIRLRWPRVRRKKSVSFNLAKDEKCFRPLSHTDKGHLPARDPKTGPQVECESETAALRELVEDLRSALQGSDARCLALEVALRREGKHGPLANNHHNGVPSNTTTVSVKATSSLLTPTQQAKELKGKATSTPAPQGRGCGVGGERPVARRSVVRPDARDLLLRELKLIRSSRDGQLEEAIRFNQRLEEELRWAYQETQKLEAAESQLRKENASIRRRAEDAREALRHGLQKVRLIQEQAQRVPGLQSRVTQLESELHKHRSQCPCRDERTPHLDDPCARKEVGFQRAVEGRAASDEDEEDRGRKEETRREEGQRCQVDEKRLSNRLHNFARGCQNSAGHQLLPSQNPLQHSAPREARVWVCTQHRCMEEMGITLKEKYEEVEGLRLEVELIETERLRLSLLEDKLTHALSLLHQLRNKNVSSRSLGKILMDALDTCSQRGLGPGAVLQVADALCSQLSSNELLREQGRGRGAEGGSQRGEVQGAQNPHSSVTNPLLISC